MKNNKLFKNIVNIKLAVEKLNGENHSGDENKKKKKEKKKKTMQTTVTVQKK